MLAALILSTSLGANAASPKISHDTPTRSTGLVDVIVQFKHAPNGSHDKRQCSSRSTVQFGAIARGGGLEGTF
jgi:hypothetical protein